MSMHKPNWSHYFYINESLLSLERDSSDCGGAGTLSLNFLAPRLTDGDIRLKWPNLFDMETDK